MSPLAVGVVLLPYLSIRERLRVGPWELIPKGELQPADAVDEETRSLALAHLAVYDLPDGDAARRCGCIARSANNKIGEPIDTSKLGTLRLAVLPALLIMNPEAQDKLNPGMVVSTSDNAILHGHPLNPEGRLAVEYGAMMKALIGGIRVRENPGFVSHPAELHLPLIGSEIDDELASILYGLLDQGTDNARRLATAVEWLDVAWRNTTFITPDVRVMALKSTFEALLNVGDKVEDGRRELSALLDDPTSTRTSHPYVNLRGQTAVTPPLTDLEWWFTKFTFLRNDIAHGSEVPDADWMFNGQGQVMLAQRRLLEAIRKKAADAAGDPDLLLPPLERNLSRRVKEYTQARDPKKCESSVSELEDKRGQLRAQPRREGRLSR